MQTAPNRTPRTTQHSGLRLSPSLKQSATVQNWLWGVLLFVTLTILVPLMILPRPPWASFAAPLLLVYASIFYSGTRLAMLAFQGERRLLSLTFWVFAYVWVGVAALAQLTTGEFKWPGAYSEVTQTYAAFIILVGYIAYDMGSRMARSHKVTLASEVSSRGFQFSKGRIYLLGVLAILISTFAISLLPDVGMLFGPHEVVQDQIIASFSKTGSLLFFSLLRVPAFVALLLVWWVWLRRKDFGVFGAERAWLVALLFGLAGVNALVSNPISSPRYFVGTVVLSLAFMTLHWSKRHSFGLWVSGLLTALIVVFPYADLFRRGAPEVEFQSVTSKLAISGDYDSFQQMMNTIEFVADKGITYGGQLLGVLFFWVPRNIWVSKPLASGELVAGHSGYSFTTIASPLWAESYINAGLLGVVVGLFAYGALTSVLQRAYLQSTSPYSVINVLVPLLAAYQIFLVRGTLMSSFAYLMPIIGYLALSVLLTRSSGARSPRKAGRSRSLSLALRRRRL